MRYFVVHLLDDSRAILPGPRIVAVPPVLLRGVVETWQSPGPERILFVDAEAHNPIGWLEEAIEIVLDEPPGRPAADELAGLRAIESMAAPKPKERCPECKYIFGHSEDPRCSLA